MIMRRIILSLILAAAAALGAGCAQSAPGDTTVLTETASAETAAEQDSGPFENFRAEDLLGGTCTQEVFSDRDITIVNLMATWCGPCIAEMPGLEELYENSNVGVVAVAIDTSTNGEVDEEAVESALQLADELSLTFPFLMPDENDFSGLTRTIQVVPTSYLVDKSGKVVAGPIEGAMSADDWLQAASIAAENTSK